MLSSLPFAEESSDPLHLTLPVTTGWDPATLSAGDQVQVLLADLLYEGLTDASAEGELRPALAETWTPSQDFRQWTFELADGVDARAVAASFARLRELAPASVAVTLVNDVETIDPAGASSVRFTLRNPNADFAWLLSGVQYSIYGEEPTGPYRIESQDAVGMTLTSDRYRTIEVKWSADSKAAYDRLTLGETDAAVVDATLIVDAARRLGQQPSARSLVRVYGLNLASPNLSDPRLRQAVLSAVDRPGVMGALTTSGFTTDSVSASSIAGFRYGACGAACVYNPAEATAKLAEVGFTPTLVVGYVGPEQAAAARSIGESLTRAGFGVSVQEIPADQLTAMIDAGTVDIFSFGWPAPASSMDAVIPPLFASVSPLNVTRLVSTEVDNLIAEAMTTGDDAARWRLLADAEGAALAQWTVIPVATAHNGLIQRAQGSPLVVRPDGSIDVTSLE